MIRHTLLSIIAAFALAPAAATAAGWDPRDDAADEDAAGDSKLARQAGEAIVAFQAEDKSLAVFFDKAYGYAIFPNVKKGGAGFGAARGKGIVFRAGAPTMKAYLTQISIGLQLGGKAYREILFFRDKAAYDSFVDGEFELSAQAQAVFATSGAGEQTSYSEGVAIFILDKGGAMYEASVAGQKFKVKPLD